MLIGSTIRSTRSRVTGNAWKPTLHGMDLVSSRVGSVLNWSVTHWVTHSPPDQPGGVASAEKSTKPC